MATTETDFAAFFAEHQHRALRLAFLLTGDRDQAEDATAEAFAKVYTRWSDDIRDPGAYLRRAVVNTINSTFRRRGTERRALPRLHEVVDDGDVIAGATADRDLVLEALAKLPPQQRTVLVLRYYEDRTEADIAAILGISTGAVKSNASRGLARLRTLVPTPTDLDLAA